MLSKRNGLQGEPIGIEYDTNCSEGFSIIFLYAHVSFAAKCRKDSADGVHMEHTSRSPDFTWVQANFYTAGSNGIVGNGVAERCTYLCPEDSFSEWGCN